MWWSSKRASVRDAEDWRNYGVNGHDPLVIHKHPSLSNGITRRVANGVWRKAMRNDMTRTFGMIDPRRVRRREP